MTNDQIDSILHKILKKQNINIVNKPLQKNLNANIIKNNNNINQKNMFNINKKNNNKIILKKPPNDKVPNALLNIAYKKNKNVNITYGKVESIKV